MSSPVLKIALMEPSPVCAAELGQILCEALTNVSFEILLNEINADLLLINSTAPAPRSPLRSPALLFARTEEGIYIAQELRGPSTTFWKQNNAFPTPLANALPQLATAILEHREEPSPAAASVRRIDPPPVDAAEKLHHRLLQAQKMEAVGELAGSIAHDFNNLLMVIRSYTDMMLDDPTLSPESTQNARQILAASKRAMNLAGELLAFSRKQDSNPAPTDLNGFLDSAVPMLSRMVGRKINVQVKLSRELWPIRADIAQLEQVLLNLAANARDAMPHGGTLLLETTNVVIEENQASMRKGEYVMMAVSDTGQGIPPEVLPRIFEPFFTTKERGKGTGLGLASVYGIVKHSGGYIWAYSEKGYGTTFKIYIPRLAAAQPTPESTRPLRSFAAATSGS